MKKLKNYKKIIFLPDNVEIKKKYNNLIFYGPTGSSELNLTRLDDKGIVAFNKADCSSNLKNIAFSSNSKSCLNTVYNVIRNKIIGISSGFLVSLRIVGVGYRAEIVHNKTNQILYFKIGFSHDFEYVIPKSVRAFLLEPTLICLYGIDKNQITQIAAKIREIKPPSCYKGKGIRLVSEAVFLKPGKRK